MDAEKIGGFIKERRKEAGITQKELAEKLNCTDKAVSRWETGRGIPEISMLIPLSAALGISVNELLAGERIGNEEIIEKTDSLIVETMVRSDKKVSNLKKLLFGLFLMIELIVLYAIPAASGPGDEMGVILLSFMLTALNSLIMGTTGIKAMPKLLFAVATAVLFIPSSFLLPLYAGMGASDRFHYVIFYFAAGAASLILGTGIREALVRVIRALIRKKEKQ